MLKLGKLWAGGLLGMAKATLTYYMLDTVLNILHASSHLILPEFELHCTAGEIGKHFIQGCTTGKSWSTASSGSVIPECMLYLSEFPLCPGRTHPGVLYVRMYFEEGRWLGTLRGK